jgi:exosortase
VSRQDTLLETQQDSGAPKPGGNWIAAAVDQAKRNPASALLLFTISATVIVFYFFLKLYAGAPIMVWAYKHWLPNLNQEHGWLVIPGSLLLALYHHKELRAAPKRGSNWGLTVLGLGFLILLVGIRASQARIILLSIPAILFGIALFVWGRHVARILAFPIAFLVFMIPVGALQQMSFRLQVWITNVVLVLSNAVGIKIYSIGTTLRPIAGDWGFDIAEGCSGIRSLIAIIMLTTIYAHIFEKEMWKKIVIVAFSIGFAIIANAGRIFTIILIARAGYPGLAGGLYHEYSGFLSFPIALLAMYFFHKLVNLRLVKSAATSSDKVSHAR